MILEIGILIIVIIIIYLIFKLIKKAMFIALNSIVGLLALFGFNAVFHTDVVINVWSVLITGIGGAIGFFIVIILHFLQIAF